MFSLVYIDGWRIDSKYVCMYPERPSITADYEGIIAALVTMKKLNLKSEKFLAAETCRQYFDDDQSQ